MSPTRHALWEVDKTMETLDPPVTDSHGRQITERVASVTFRTDTPLPEGYRDVLALSLQLPDLEGDTLVFPTIQTCEQGEAAWIEVPADGQDGEDLELPAPAFVLTAADGGGHDDVLRGRRQPGGRRATQGGAGGGVERRRRLDDRGPRRGPGRRRAGCDGARAPASPDVTGRRSPARLLLLLVGVAVLLLGPAAPASAHATLIGSDPVEGAVLEAAPEQVRLTFDEAVAAVPDGVQVFDAEGGPVASSAAVTGPSWRSA